MRSAIATAIAVRTHHLCSRPNMDGLYNGAESPNRCVYCYICAKIPDWRKPRSHDSFHDSWWWLQSTIGQGVEGTNPIYYHHRREDERSRITYSYYVRLNTHI